MTTDEEDDGEDEEDFVKRQQRLQKRLEEDESLFQRLEESRMKLERELGFDKFLKVYRYLQVSHSELDKTLTCDVSDFLIL